MSGCYEYFEFTQKSKPQGNALSGAVMVLLVSGMQIGWLFDDKVHKLPWGYEHSSMLIIVTFVMFYISGVIGLYAADATVNRLTKSNIYVRPVTCQFIYVAIDFFFFHFQYSALTFTFAGSVILIGFPNLIVVVLLSRFMIGFAHGYAYLAAIIHASEIVHQKLRGMIIGAFQLCIVCSAMLTSMFSTTDSAASLSSFQWIGILGLIYTLMGIIFAIFMTRESPVQLIRQKQYDKALSIMVRVRNESSETWSIKNEYNELKAMVEEDAESSQNVFQDGNMRPLMLIALLKVAFVLSFNYGLNMIRLRYTSFFITAEGFNFSGITYLTIRLLAFCITLFSLDLNGRKRHFIISHGSTSLLLLLFGVMVFIQPSNFAAGYETVQVLLEVAGGLGMGVLSDVYSSEAHNTMKKARSICLTSTIEYCFHIAIICATFNVSSSTSYDGIYLVASGVILLVLTYMLHKELPETAKMSIRQTRNEFLKQGEIVFSGSQKTTPRGITFDS